MSASVREILQNYGIVGVEVLKQSIAQIEATGKTARTIRSEVTSTDTKDRLMLIGRAYFELIEKGRRPTDKGPSPEMIELLTDYAKARGMDKPKSAAWAIAKTINKEGDKTYRAGGRDVYSTDLGKFVDELKTAIAKVAAKDYITQMKGAFKNGGSN